jgi:hypothetical protein
MTNYLVAEGVIAVVAADTPAEARRAVRKALDAHGFDPMPTQFLPEHLGADDCEPDADAHPLPGPCQAPTAEWSAAVEDFTRWGLTAHDVQTLVRLAASGVDTGTLTAHTEGFSEPDDVDALAHRTWRAMAHMDGWTGAEPWKCQTPEPMLGMTCGQVTGLWVKSGRCPECGADRNGNYEDEDAGAGARSE